MERLTERERNLDGTGRSKEPLIYEKKGLTFLSAYTGKILKKLADYEDAEEQGLLVRFPCKVGDTVYFYSMLFGNRVIKAEVKSIELLKSVMGNIRYLVEPVSRRGSLFKYYDNEFGENIFLTQEAAEQALREKEDKNAD